MTKNDLVASLCERPFDPKVTLSQIIDEGRSKFLEWNIRKEIITISNEYDECVGMFMKFQHSNYNDMLMVTLGWDDLYHIRFMDEDTYISKEFDGLYHDQLFEVIDRHVKTLTPSIVKDICLN